MVIFKTASIRTNYLCRTQTTYKTLRKNIQRIFETINHNQIFNEFFKAEAINSKTVA